MTDNGTWVSYGGDARTWLAVGLLGAAGGIILAGLRLRLPLAIGARRPTRAGQAAMIAAWAASIVALLASVTIYLRQSMQAYDLSAPAAASNDPITPVTFTAVVVLFVVIVIVSRRYAWRTRLASGFIGAMVAPMIFELPFDVIVMPRSHPVVDPGRYRALLFGCLFAIEITTLLLLRLSPLARLTRDTFFSLALMVSVFAVWALAGFGYPSAPLPIALNVASKILAFVAALTLFLPGRPAAGRAAPSPEVRDAARPRGRLMAGAACGVVAVALVTAGCSSPSRATGAAATPASGPLWLCKPGQLPDPCDGSTAVSAVTASGAVGPAARPSSAAASTFACFYLNPTTSATQTAAGNTGLTVTPIERYIATEFAVPLSQVCDVWSPLYRAQTFPTVVKGLAGDEELMRSTFTVAYDSVLPAWR